MQTKSPEQEVDQPYLTDMVRKALDRPALQLTGWKVKPLHGGMEWDSAVFRFHGDARDAGESIPWSLILKVARPIPQAMDPGGIWYWKREVLAYQSGMLYSLPGGNVSAPACHTIEERPDGTLWLWLDDLKDGIGSQWPLEHYAVAARHLGRFNGAYLVGQNIPSESWVTCNWLRQYVEHASSMIEFIRNKPDLPIVLRLYPGDSLAQILATWDVHNSILDVLENLPQVFCHQDAFKRNMFARGEQTILIDWSYTGIAPVGAELVALVAGTIGLFEVPADRVKELDRICFEGYVQGLRDAGWNGDARLVRIGYAVSCMLRYTIGGSVGEVLPRLLDQESRARMESSFDKSADELEKSDPALIAFYQALIPEALKLLGLTRFLNLITRMGVNILQVRAKRKK
jgi:hypothetical protein